MKKVMWNRKMFENDKFYGTATVGTRGQVVIPAEARKDLGIKPGDQMVVMGKFGKALGLVKAEQISEIIAMIMEEIAGSNAEADFKAHVHRVLSAYTPLTKSKPDKR